jgi:uncharacterized membrane protein YgdD (TMEM256/DUF423 family)
MTMARVLTVTATVLTLCGLYVMDWFPSRVIDPHTFLEYRSEHVAARAQATEQEWWEVVSLTYFEIGYVVQTAAFLLLPFVVARRDRWHRLAVLTLLGAVWQVVGLLGSEIVNTTVAPVVGPFAGILAFVGWRLARSVVGEQTPV